MLPGIAIVVMVPLSIVPVVGTAAAPPSGTPTADQLPADPPLSTACCETAARANGGLSDGYTDVGGRCAGTVPPARISRAGVLIASLSLLK
ncbi:MAG: hypothetical protein F4160_04015 [Rhodospirillaceae bacterium]|nr:hypothetical protein [Rhodospirillaceae bacterium]MYF86469.1 hypothetical protein [Rhodospirillaceae bacterium]MYH35947.1 hypothetical protein [Rhodospirillaceae bacterium]